MNLYSKRQKQFREEINDVYSYENIPNKLLVQIIHIWNRVLGNQNNYEQYGSQVPGCYKYIYDILCEEYGVFDLFPNIQRSSGIHYYHELCKYLLALDDEEKIIDIIELTFTLIDTITRENTYLGKTDPSKEADEAIVLLNSRFKENGIGFQFIDGHIIKVDSEFLHTNTIKPVLKLLNDKNYGGAQDEFLKAYEHYRHNENKEALNNCLKSLESTMKTICDKHRWDYGKSPNASHLINICFKNNLIPEFWQQQFTSLRSTLESGVPTGRNKLSGHGQGEEIIKVPEYIVSYMLNLTGAAIILLINSEKELANR